MWATVASYAVIATLGLAVYCYYNPEAYKRWTQHVPAQIADQSHAQPKKPKPKRVTKLTADENASSTATSSNEAPAAKKRKLVSPPINNTVEVKISQGDKTVIPRVEEDGMSNTAFAQQLKQAQTGTKLEKQTLDKPTKKDRRAAKAAGTGNAQGLESPNFSADNSSTGARDADDDMSPNDTPPTSASRAGDVSDMLEPAPAKPQTLRLTSTDAPQQKKPGPKQQFEPAESKKARQRRKKQEENRLLREESDRLHEAKKQHQMRAARMADGSAKQTKANNFAQNAWQSKPAETSQAQRQSQSQSAGAGLLDTFEPENKESVTTKPISDITNKPEANVEEVKEDIGGNKTEALAASKRERPNLSQTASWADQMDANEQDEWAEKLLEQDQWNEVSSKKAKKKNKKENQDTSSEASLPLHKTISETRPQNSMHTNGVSKPQSQNRFEAVGGEDVWEA
jgi:hypothetical protein